MIDHERMILDLRKVGSTKKEFSAILDDWHGMKMKEMENLDERKVQFLANIERRAEQISKECDLIQSLKERLVGKEVALILPSELVVPPVEEKKGFFKRGKK